MTAFVQQNTVVTTTSGPASIAAALSVASTAGNLLLMWVNVVSSAANAAITTPANWTLIASQVYASGNRILALFALPNNAGGISGVTVTITNTTGGAAATMLEFSGIGTAPPTEANIGTTAASDGATLPLANQYPPAKTVAGIALHAWGYAGVLTVVAANSQGFSATQTGNASGATVNASLSSWFYIVTGPGNLQNGGTLSSGNTYGMLVIRIGGNGGPQGIGAGGIIDAGMGSPNMFGSFGVG